MPHLSVNETIRPFDDEKLAEFKYVEMMRLANEELEARKNNLRLKRIQRVASELFGDDFVVPED